MNIVALLISLLSGAVGGNVVGRLAQKLDLGVAGNSIAGILGGGIGGQILSHRGMPATTPAGFAGDLTIVIGQIAAGSLGGGVIMAIISAIKQAMVAARRLEELMRANRDMALVQRGAIVLTQPSFKLGMFVLVMSGMLVPTTVQLLHADSAKTGTLKLELNQDNASEYRWRLKAANGEILATGGQGYKAKADAKNRIERIKSDAGTDKVKFEDYTDDKGDLRWRLHASNGQVIASSSQGYKAKEDCDHSVELIKKNAADAEVAEAP